MIFMSRNTVFTILFVVLIGTIGYTWYYYWQSPSAGAPVQEEFVRSIAQVQRLKDLDIDTSLFQDKAFMELEAPPEFVEPEIIPGRSNPFASF